MFRKYGIAGITIIFLIELNFFFKIEPFATWYFPIVWLGYIMTVDAIVYKIRHDSLLSNRPYQLLGMFFISALFWWLFEILNIGTQNWAYEGLDGHSSNAAVQFFGILAFGTVVPALFETVELIRSLHLFNDAKLKKKHKITKKLLKGMMFGGIFCLVLPFLIPQFAFPLVWLSFFLILDPINYMHKQPSIIQHWKDRKLSLPLALLLSGIILGFFWEFWNYWAVPKWTYDVPYVGFLKIFEMPLLGYLGYLPFALELYTMYWFVRSLLMHKEKLLVE